MVSFFLSANSPAHSS